MGERKKKGSTKPKSWTFWMGFSDGKPFCWTEPDRAENVLSASPMRAVVANHYEDVRKVRITEVLPNG